MNRACAAGAVCIAATVLTMGDTLSFVGVPVSDAMLRMAAAHPPAGNAPEIAIIAIDAQSLRALEDEWPWPRDRHAELVRRLDGAGAKAIGFDIDFSTLRDPKADAEFADAIAASGRVILAAHREFQQIPGAGELEVASFPAAPFARGAAAIGAALVHIDTDGTVRRAFHARSIAGELLPSFSEAILNVAFGDEPPRRESEPFRIDYRRIQPPVRVIPAVDVLEGRFDPRDIAGHLVLIGGTAVEFQDLWSTPIGHSHPGVLIQALALRTSIAARAGAMVLEDIDRKLEIALIALISVAAAMLGIASPAGRIAGLALLASAILSGTLLLLVTTGTLIDPLVPLAVVGAHYGLGLELVRRRMGRRLEERELSLSTLFKVGEASLNPEDRSGLDAALALLGEVVDASGVALLRSSPSGEIDGERLQWDKSGDRPIGDIDAATMVLFDRKTRIFEGSIPGRSLSGGLAIYTPLFSGSAAVGVLVVEQDCPRELQPVQLRTIATVGTQLALSVENLRLLRNLEQTYHASMVSFASAVESRDGYSEMHCRRLAAFSAVMAERLGVPSSEVESIRLGALLHDVGKIGICDSILLKPERLNPDERRHIEEHSIIGYRIVATIDGVSPTTANIVRHHHERWNGTGYPDGLAGEEIPLGARIVSLVDVWDALSTRRPYKGALPQPRVRDILRKDSGVRFEPALVDLFLEVLDEEGTELVGPLDPTVGVLS